MHITPVKLISISVAPVKNIILIAWLRYRVNYWKKQRAFSIEAQSQERARQRRIEEKLVACRADLLMMEHQ